MKNNFYNKSLGNIYSRPYINSNVATQILYGDKFIILSKNKNWIKIKTSFDRYTGYIKNDNFVRSFKPTHKIYILKSKILSSEQHFQKLDKNYIPNGGVWCVKVSELKKQKSVYSYPIDIVEVPFKYSIDIDTHEDLLFARLMFKEYKIKLS